MFGTGPVSDDVVTVRILPGMTGTFFDKEGPTSEFTVRERVRTF
jgi:hypothetical protein